jgi:GTPase
VPIGLEEHEFDETLENLRKMAAALQADVSVICEKYVTRKNEDALELIKQSKQQAKQESIAIAEPEKETPNETKLPEDQPLSPQHAPLDSSLFGDQSPTTQQNKKKFKVGEVLIRKFGNEQYLDIRIAVCGNVDSGKSTLIGVLTRGKLDNGRGYARMNVFQHKHEVQTGRTSSVSHQIVGFDSKGSIVNYSLVGTPDWKEIIEKSSKVCTFIDLAGHEKYLKTTVFGMTGSLPDYSCVVVGSNMGVTRMTKEHIGLCLALKIPIFVVVTKIDICPDNVLKDTIQTIHKILKLPGVRKIPIHIKNEDDVLMCAKNIAGDRVTPIFLMSSVTGENIKLLRQFLNLLPVRRDWENRAKDHAEFIIDQTFFVAGVGTVVSGIVNQGSISVNDSLMIGPDGNGMFRPVQIKSIHCKRVSVKRAQAGQHASLALKKEKRSQLRKGMVLVENKALAKSCWEFEAEVVILYHSTTIKSNYQPVIHCMCVRQAAKIVNSNIELRTGDKAIVRFRFMFRPEYMRVGERLIFREGRTKGLGVITKLYPVQDVMLDNATPVSLGNEEDKEQQQ